MNKSLERLALSDGQMPSVKPLSQVLQIFGRIRELSLVNIELNDLHFLTIENYIVKHD